MSDVFISHSSKDKEIADKVVKFLEDKGLTCWIAPRDIVPGSDWAASISTAITASKVFLIIYSVNSAASEQVAREVSLAESKQNVFVVPYKIDDTGLSGTFEYFLTGAHWISANYSKKDYKLEELYTIVSGITGKNVQNITNNTYIDHLHIHNTDDLPGDIQKGVQEMSGQVKSPAPQNNTGSSKKKVRLIAIIAAVLILGTGIAIAANSHKKSGDNPSSSSGAVSSAKLNDCKMSFCGWDCTGTYEGEVNADNVPDGKGKYVGSYTNSSGYVHNVTIEGDFTTGSVTGNFDTVMEYSAEEDIKTWNQNGEFSMGKLTGKGKTEFIYRSGNISSSIQEGEFNDGVLRKGTITTIYVDGTKSVAEGEWDEKGSNISGTVTNYDKNGNVVADNTSNTNKSSSDTSSLTLFTFASFLNASYDDVISVMGENYHYEELPHGYAEYSLRYQLKNLNFMGIDTIGSVSFEFDKNNKVNAAAVNVGENVSDGTNTISSDKLLKQYADTAYSVVTSRYGDSTTKEEKADGDYIFELWENIKDSDYPDLYEIFFYSSSNAWGGTEKEIVISFTSKDRY